MDGPTLKPRNSHPTNILQIAHTNKLSTVDVLSATRKRLLHLAFLTVTHGTCYPARLLEIGDHKVKKNVSREKSLYYPVDNEDVHYDAKRRMRFLYRYVSLNELCETARFLLYTGRPREGCVPAAGWRYLSV